MSIRLASRRSAVVGLALTTVVAGGIAAYAYPPGTKMTVSAAASSNGSTVVTVENVNPDCTVTVRVDGGTPPSQVLTPTGTTASFTFQVSGTGRHNVRAQTDCPSHVRDEHARNRFVVPNGTATAPATAEVGKYYRIDVSGVPEGQDVTLVATGPGGAAGESVHNDVADRRGNASLRVRLPVAGQWNVVVAAEGTTIATLNPIAS